MIKKKVKMGENDLVNALHETVEKSKQSFSVHHLEHLPCLGHGDGECLLPLLCTLHRRVHHGLLAVLADRRACGEREREKKIGDTIKVIE
jgi:hypothetical protein